MLMLKIDLSEFRSETLKGIGLGGLPPGRRGVVSYENPLQSGHGCDSQATERLTSVAIYESLPLRNIAANPKP